MKWLCVAPSAHCLRDSGSYVVPFAMYELGCLIGPESPAGCELLKQAKGLGVRVQRLWLVALFLLRVRPHAL